MYEAANPSTDDICFVTPDGVVIGTEASARCVPSAAIMALEIAEAALTLGDIAISAGHAEKTKLLAAEMRDAAKTFMEAAQDTTLIGSSRLLFGLSTLVEQLTAISQLVLPAGSASVEKAVTDAHAAFDAEYFNLLTDGRRCLHQLDQEPDIATRDARAFFLANLMLDLIGWLLAIRATEGPRPGHSHPIPPPQPVGPFLRATALQSKTGALDNAIAHSRR